MTDVYNCPSCGEESICTPECEGLRVAFRDITHRVEAAEQELRETAGELEKARARVTEATALLERVFLERAHITRVCFANLDTALTLDIKNYLRAPARPAPTPDPVRNPALPTNAEIEAQQWDNGHVTADEQPAAPTPDVPWDTENPGRCSECDPSFGCFNGSAPCSKTPYEQPAAPEPSADYRRGYKEGSDDTAHELLSGRERDNRLADAVNKATDHLNWHARMMAAEAEAQALAASELNAFERLTTCLDELGAEQALRLSAEAQLAAVRRVVDRLRNAALPVDPQLIVQKLDQALTPAPSPGAGGGK